MVDDSALYPPATYAAGGLLLGVGLLVVIALVVLAVVVTTRPRRSTPRWGRRSTRVRRGALARIDAIEQAHRAGELNAPAAASELSQVVRHFAADWTGVLYPAMTLAAIEESDGEEGLAAVIAPLSDLTFRPAGGPLTVAAAAATAREVVTGWNRS